MAAKRVGSAAVILNGEGHVLLVKHGYGPLNWELPGGGSEPGESVIDTAIREVKEETGLTVEPVRLTGVYYIDSLDGVGFVFLCRITAGEPFVNDAAEITDCRYWPPDALPRPISDWTIRRIEDAFRDAPALMPVLIEQVTVLR